MNGNRGAHYLGTDSVFVDSAIRLRVHCASPASSALSLLAVELLKTLPVSSHIISFRRYSLRP
jgi:hypothetical protein